MHPWAFSDEGRVFHVRADGPLIFNDGDVIEAAALDGLGIAYLHDDQVADSLAEGRLIPLLEKWCPPFPGFHLYHPSRRQMRPALSALIDVLRYKK